MSAATRGMIQLSSGLATVECVGRWRVIEVGLVFDCQVAVADGRTAVARVTTQDGDGTIGWKVE